MNANVALGISIIALASGVARADIPEIPEGPAPGEEYPEMRYGADASVGAGVATLMNPWAESGFCTTLSVRYDTFLVPRELPGARLGLSIFAESSMGLLQTWKSSEGSGDLHYLHYGLLSVLRFDPSLPWSGLAGLGFGRLELQDYFGGSQPVPMLSFEGGVRRQLGRPQAPWTLDTQLRLSWGSSRAPEEAASPWYLKQGESLADWWLVGLGISLGGHAR